MSDYQLYQELTTEKTFTEKVNLLDLPKENKKIIKDIYDKKKFDNNFFHEIVYFDINLLNKLLDILSENDPDFIDLNYIFRNITHVEFYENLYKENLSSILIKETSDGIYKCPKCQSSEVNTQTRQVRSADEAATDFNSCLTCGYKWRIN